MKKLIVLLMSLFLMMSSVVFVQATNHNQCTGADIMPVFDRSGSMSGTPLADAKTATKALIDAGDVTVDRFGLVSYSSSASLNHVLSTDFPSVKIAVDALAAGGLTCIGCGIDAAQAHLDSDGRDQSLFPHVIVLLSDGFPNIGSPNGEAAAIAAADAAKAKGTIVFTVAFGGANVPLMESLATSPGHAFVGLDSGDLPTIFTTVGNEICNLPDPLCGDGNLDAGEQCDDGNLNDGDGCSAICEIETSTPPPQGDVPEFGTVGALAALAGAGLYMWKKRK